MKTYLCGPISGCTKMEANGWREKCERLLHGMTLNPMRRDYAGPDFSGDIYEKMNEIVELDKVDITHCSCLLVHFPDTPKPFIGSAMEMLYAWGKGKLVVLVLPPDSKPSPWLLYHSHYHFHSFEEACEFINNYDGMPGPRYSPNG